MALSSIAFAAIGQGQLRAQTNSAAPKDVAGAWKICGTAAVVKEAGNVSDWGMNPIGKTIIFADGYVGFEGKRYAVVYYKSGKYDSADDFRTIQGIEPGSAGLKPKQRAIWPALLDKKEDGVVSSEIYPTARDYLVLNWDGWFLSAARVSVGCGERK